MGGRLWEAKSDQNTLYIHMKLSTTKFFTKTHTSDILEIVMAGVHGGTLELSIYHLPIPARSFLGKL